MWGILITFALALLSLSPSGGGKGEYTGPRLPMCLSIRELSEILGAKGIILEQCEPSELSVHHAQSHAIHDGKQYGKSGGVSGFKTSRE